MKEISFIVSDEEGLHARPVCSLMMAVKDFSCESWLVSGKRKADMNNLMELMALGVRKGEKILLQFSGQQEEAAYESVRAFLAEWQ